MHASVVRRAVKPQLGAKTNDLWLDDDDVLVLKSVVRSGVLDGISRVRLIRRLVLSRVGWWVGRPA